MHPVLWWILFTFVCIWCQFFIPGVDFFAPGLVLMMQEQRLRYGVWFVLVWILVLEGTATIAFGSSLLWYAMLVFLFWLGRKVFESTNFLFIILLGAVMGLWHVGLFEMMGQLQNLSISRSRLISQGLVQSVAFVAEWLLIYILYKNRVRHDRQL
ncbi:hypothetical protein [Desulfobaculum bizertense]|uniref:Rod shape-determining protein MreD n=1 Tax=Desulfobaculum bizertense DSM 18034 TaxID=1121442 RepID=A0A1T4WU21_9BACT|nr:hypothetical protein [Desulfobaculum bizertense]UIJ37258.1 hypothetical protein LWC08_11005 [Desulfobaculum bizertense]SKA80121.1 hypothetical protein SAMN02745702_02614 [Desulfobaculum bizertense DSM 18034]